jgi:carbon-monoxide dehydrogenase medium subunit
MERPGAILYAGGTDLMVALTRDRAPSPGELVDIKGVQAARGIRDDGARLRVGALVTAAELANDPLVSSFASALRDAAAATAAPMLQARATVGGNIATPHPAPDVAASLLTLSATVCVATGPDAVERLAVEDALIRGGLGRLESGGASPAMILAVEVPKATRSAFGKLGTRGAFSRSTLAAGVSILDDACRVVLCGDTARPFVAESVGAALSRGNHLCDSIAADLQAAITSDGSGTVPNRARLRLIAGLVRATAERAGAREGDR